MGLPSGNLTWLWKITIFNGKIHYKWGIFNSYVSLPEGNPISGDHGLINTGDNGLIPLITHEWLLGIGHVDINPTTLDEVQHFTNLKPVASGQCLAIPIILLIEVIRNSGVLPTPQV